MELLTLTLAKHLILLSQILQQLGSCCKRAGAHRVPLGNLWRIATVVLGIFEHISHCGFHQNIQRRKNVHDHHRKKITWSTFLASQKKFQAGGRYENPIKKAGKAYLLPKSFLCGPPFLFSKKNLWSRVVYGCFFPDTGRCKLWQSLGFDVAWFFVWSGRAWTLNCKLCPYDGDIMGQGWVLEGVL